MYPEIRILDKSIPTYGLMAIVGFFLSLIYILVIGRWKKLKTEDGIYVFTMGAIGMLIGAKLLFLLQVLPSFIRDLPMLFSDFRRFFALYFAGGMIFYGGLFGALIAAWLTAKSFHDDIKELYPMLVPSIALVAGFGRIGCFLTGCCYGKETNLPIGVMFTHSLFAPNYVKLIPTQLIESIFDFLLFLCLIIIANSRLRDYSLAIYLMIYAVFRFVIEFFRGDAIRGFLWGLSTSQWISIFVLTGASVWILIKCRRKKEC